VVFQMADDFDANPFWDYSLEVYGRDGVSPALITFQDRHGLDVNMLLLCLWSGQSGRGELDDADFEHALAVSASWNPEIVCALRAVRIRLRDEVALVPKALSDAVRKKLLGVEIECERVEQLSMAAGLRQRESRSKTPRQKLEDCGRSFSAYFNRRGCRPDAEDRRALVTILSAAFDDIAGDEVRSFCEEMFA
jgi:uncharacterized protein (TIGR02444 family)